MFSVNRPTIKRQPMVPLSLPTPHNNLLSSFKHYVTSKSTVFGTKRSFNGDLFDIGSSRLKTFTIPEDKWSPTNSMSFNSGDWWGEKSGTLLTLRTNITVLSTNILVQIAISDTLVGYLTSRITKETINQHPKNMWRPFSPHIFPVSSVFMTIKNILKSFLL